MSKTTLALAAALLAGTTMTGAAHADAVRVGFGFPLGSFVAHSNESYSSRDYRPAERRRVVRRIEQDDPPARKVVKIKQPPKAEIAQTPVKAPVLHTAKLENKLSSDPATTTVIEKTPAAKSDAAPTAPTTASIAPVETKASQNAEKVSVADKPATTETAATPTETTHICRRYVPAVAALVDVPCD